MSLDTQTFGITRHWLSVGLKLVPRHSDIFARTQLSFSRKEFLAGKNQLQAIRSWLANAEVSKASGRSVSLTPRGEQMALRDELAQRAWTWWMFHLHLCANRESYPYSAFFTSFEADGAGWLTVDEIVDELVQLGPSVGVAATRASVATYFQGVDNSLRPGWPLYALGLVERRRDAEGVVRLKKRLVKPPVFVVAYATMLFHQRYFSTQPTIEMRVLLQKGLGRSLGMRDNDMREALAQATQEPGLSRFVQYKRTVNLDSVQVEHSGEPGLAKLAAAGYGMGDIRWA